MTNLWFLSAECPRIVKECRKPFDEAYREVMVAPSLAARRRADAGLEEERRELLECVAEAVLHPEPDADRMAACTFLLRHLAAPGNIIFPSAIM